MNDPVEKVSQVEQQLRKIEEAVQEQHKYIASLEEELASVLTLASLRVDEDQDHEYVPLARRLNDMYNAVVTNTDRISYIINRLEL
jgi:hypothetical protein